MEYPSCNCPSSFPFLRKVGKQHLLRIGYISSKGLHLNKLTIRGRILWLESVIPLAMKLVSGDVKSFEFLIADFDAGWIGVGVLDGRDD